jgi:hypothetical protein
MSGTNLDVPDQPSPESRPPIRIPVGPMLDQVLMGRIHIEIKLDYPSNHLKPKKGSRRSACN